MNHHGGGHRRKQYRGADDYDSHDRRRDTFDTPEQKLRKTIINLGEVDPVQELPRLASDIRAANEAATAAGGPAIPAITEGFRIGVTEQPFKIPYYAALLRLLHDPPAEAEENPPTDGSPTLGKQVLEDFWKGFQTFLDKLAWREIRLCIQFFAHCTMAGLVSSQTMFELFRSFTAVLQEFGVSHGRAMKAALSAAEGLMIAGPIMSKSGADVTEIITAISDYSESMTGSKNIVQPVVRLHEQSSTIEHADELLDSAIAALYVLKSSDFAQTADSFPQPYVEYPEFGSPPFELPSVLVPPEVIELDGLTTEAGEDAQVKKEEWPAYFVRLFDNDVTPDPTTPSGYAIRSAILDILDVFEVNRKECARLLLEYPKWTLHGTFKPRPGAPEQEPVPEKNWQLENSIIEITLGSIFLLPESTYRSIYYIALITEICKLSPQTVGPAVGKSIRKLYTLLSDGLDVEVAHRFAEWFSVHMSNFGFAWVWKEWAPDVSLSARHPKRRFVRKALEYEIRLSYFDRILKTLPEAMQTPEAQCMPEEAPGPEYDYDDPSKPYHDAAQSLLSLLRGRTKAEDVVSHLDSLKNSISETAEGNVNVSTVVRNIAVQSLLHIGNRSFSHFLNAIERYLPLLRNIASGGGAGATGGSNLEARLDILNAVANYWKRVRNMVVIVFDKLMQYQIVDPPDVVSWAFAYGGALTGAVGKSTFDSFQWDVLKGALDKANGRVTIARKKVTALRKEADDTAARAIATEGAAMEVDAEAKPDVMHASESPALTNALKAFATLTREQKAVLARTLDGFVGYLVAEGDANPTAAEVIAEKSWHNRINWNEVQWGTWETWCWFRHFCRAYSPYLRNYTQSLEEASLTKIGPSDPAVDLFKKTWNIATGQDV
ncbi:MIF4G like-domain-containing protein [Rhodofomes roseus]|uniref:MIF4G like-domain-containing protein n=1 Tax=Rhodofomes roseus TaxID=34475 RepID=A0ABQ8KY10_9APHY|nr:MIF4G like-domain-containing protein [Rhodofomes roseus]KAH9843775.1 MIF4G like-domain-containing protein [Rhodofomes roseus]